MGLDFLLVCVTCGRLDAHTWAKASLFRGWIGWVMKKLGGVSFTYLLTGKFQKVPVMRRQDAGEELSEERRQALTDELFSSSYDTLLKGCMKNNFL